MEILNNNDNNTIIISHSQPYTFSRLKKLIIILSKTKFYDFNFSNVVIGQSIC